MIIWWWTWPGGRLDWMRSMSWSGAELIRVAGARWAIEECFQTAKNEAGLDHYQVRTGRA